MSSAGANLAGPLGARTRKPLIRDPSTRASNDAVSQCNTVATEQTSNGLKPTTRTRRGTRHTDTNHHHDKKQHSSTQPADRRPKRVSHRRAQPTFVQELHDRHRWKREALTDQHGWRMWYREHDNTWQPRYEIRRSDLMMYVSGGDKLEHDDMYGLYAARRYDSGEAITVYVGHDIGAADGNEDDYKAYRTIERDAAPWLDTHGRMHNGNGGRHVMQVGKRLIDGQRDGYTGAQYANSAYRVPLKWTNKAELKAGGTIRVMQNKTIYPGEEILFAYHNEYWKRWGMASKRGRKAKPQTPTQESGTGKAARTTTAIEHEEQTTDPLPSHGAAVTPDATHVHMEEQTNAVGTRIIAGNCYQLSSKMQ